MRSIVAAVALVLATPSARADDVETLQARAGRLVSDASQAERAKDYATAIAKLQEAYALVPHPDLLYNLGQAYRLAGKPWDAIDQYERYLAIEPHGGFARKARRFTAALRQSLAGQTRPTPAPEPAAPPPPAPAPAPLRATPAAPRLVSRPLPPARVVERHGAWQRPVAIATGVVGLASLGVSAWQGLRARAMSHDLSAHTGAWTREALDLQAAGARAERVSIWTGAVGGALVIGSVVLAWRAHERATPTLAIAPVVDRADLGVVIHGAW